MANASTTIAVTFGSGLPVTGHLSAEVDTRATGLNQGVTSFLAGQVCWFLVYMTSDVNVTDIQSSAGSITAPSECTISKTENLVFTNSSTASLSVPATAITSHIWLGRSLGNLTLTDSMNVKTDNIGVAICQVTYTADALAYGIVSPSVVSGVENYSVLVLITGEQVGNS